MIVPLEIMLNIEKVLIQAEVNALAKKDLSVFLESRMYLRDVTNIAKQLVSIKSSKLTFDIIRDDIFKFQQKMRSEKISKLVQRMREPLRRVPFREGFVPTSLLRMRDSWRDWTYVGIAHFKSPQRFYYCSGEYDLQPILMDVGEVPCMNHSCDLLYKEWRNSNLCGYLPYKSPVELEAKFKDEVFQPLEFMDPTTHETRDEELYVLAGFSGKFLNIPTFQIPLYLYDST